MADVPKSLYRRYIEVSEATFQALLKNHSENEIQIISQFSISHRLIKALRDVCHVFFQHLGFLKVLQSKLSKMLNALVEEK
jgi:hypothetical protein